MTEPSRVLIVDDSPTQLAQIRMLLDPERFTVLTAADGREGIDVFAAERPEVVITDLRMPRMNGLELVAAIKELAPGVPVILTTCTGNEEIAAEALRRGATSYVPKSAMHESLAETVNQVLAVRLATSRAVDVCDCLTQVQLELQLPNNSSLVPGVISRLHTAVNDVRLFDEMEWTQIAMALDEAILNAMIHGNLEVSSALREVDDGQPYTDQIEKRQHQSPYRERRVFVSLTASRTQAIFVIRDEGAGFDMASVPDPTDPANLENVSGRGLLLINAFMDEIKHNDRGNEITMLKRKSSAGEAAAGGDGPSESASAS